SADPAQLTPLVPQELSVLKNNPPLSPLLPVSFPPNTRRLFTGASSLSARTGLVRAEAGDWLAAGSGEGEMFGTPSTTPAFGTPSSTPAFCTPPSTPAFGTPLTPSFAATGSSSLFPFLSPFTQTQQQQSPFTPFQQQQTPQPFGFQPQPSTSLPPFGNVPSQQQLTTQMAPVAPLPLPLADRDIQAIVDAYREDPSNPKYSFRHLLFSVTDPAARVKPVAISDILWAESMGKLEGMDSADRERLWPQLVQGFKDLSDRIKVHNFRYSVCIYAFQFAMLHLSLYQPVLC
ncbi:hypothetical protein Taro_008727, partial [Colocasia esculenta]|nr:hypothetical protein [Colocasia esculenta]